MEVDPSIIQINSDRFAFELRMYFGRPLQQNIHGFAGFNVFLLHYKLNFRGLNSENKLTNAHLLL